MAETHSVLQRLRRLLFKPTPIQTVAVEGTLKPKHKPKRQKIKRKRRKSRSR